MEMGSGSKTQSGTNESKPHISLEKTSSSFVPRIVSSRENWSVSQADDELSTVFTGLFTNSAKEPEVDSQTIDVLQSHVTVKNERAFGANDSMPIPTVSVLNMSHTTLLNQSENSPTVLIVGITCGILGLLLGIFITAAVWIYKSKKTKVVRIRHASIHEKNPKEMTFEPLDMSLTLPKNDRTPNILDTRKSLTDILAINSSKECNQLSGRHKEIELYRHYSCSSPSFINRFSYNKGEDFPCSENEVKKFGSVSSRKADARSELSPFRYTSGMHLQKLSPLPIPLMKRDSFSSGLGTGTESDVISFECKASPIHNKSMTESVPLPYHLPTAENSQYVRYEQCRRSQKGPLEVVRETNGRRSKRSCNAHHKKRLTRKSNESSSCASSGTASIQEWSSTETSCSRSSTLLSLTYSSPAPNDSSISAIPRDKTWCENNNLTTKEWDSGDEAQAVSDAQDKDQENKVESATEDDDDVVLTYFGMHIPGPPRLLNTKCPNESSSSAAVLLCSSIARTNMATVVRSNSNATINL